MYTYWRTAECFVRPSVIVAYEMDVTRSEREFYAAVLWTAALVPLPAGALQSQRGLSEVFT